ncbi:hypothetical protein ABZ917_01075 [Nonomuraea wenchangensis]
MVVIFAAASLAAGFAMSWIGNDTPGGRWLFVVAAFLPLIFSLSIVLDEAPGFPETVAIAVGAVTFRAICVALVLAVGFAMSWVRDEISGGRWILLAVALTPVISMTMGFMVETWRARPGKFFRWAELQRGIAALTAKNAVLVAQVEEQRRALDAMRERTKTGRHPSLATKRKFQQELAVLEAEVKARTAQIDELDKLLAIKKEQAAAIRKMLLEVLDATLVAEGRKQWMFLALGVVASIPVGVAINLLVP